MVTRGIGRRLAAIDEVLRSVALQTPMNSHSELNWTDTLRNIQTNNKCSYIDLIMQKYFHEIEANQFIYNCK